MHCGISEAGDGWRTVWGLEKGGKPTSDFPNHFMNQSVRKAVTDGEHRVIYHAHTPSLIALTYVPPLTSRDFTRVLWQSATECPVVSPGGVSVVSWMVPGSAEIAMATSEVMKEFEAAVWAHQGLFYSGPDVDTNFGLVPIKKASDIYVRACSCGCGVRQTKQDSDLSAIAKSFGVQLRAAFLD